MGIRVIRTYLTNIPQRLFSWKIPDRRQSVPTLYLFVAKLERVFGER